MKSKMNCTFVTFGLVGALLFTASPGHAAHPQAGVTDISTSVLLADLNLSSDAGVEVLYRRLQQAARKVCGSQNLHVAGSLGALKSNRRCVDTSLDRAVAEIGHEALAKRHDA